MSLFSIEEVPKIPWKRTPHQGEKYRHYFIKPVRGKLLKAVVEILNYSWNIFTTFCLEVDQDSKDGNS